MIKYTVVVTGPSGIGKTYLAEQLTLLQPDMFEIAKLHTTRNSRPDEAGSDRIFVDKADFKKMDQANFFGVTGVFHDNLYGYSREALAPKNKHIIVNTWPAMIPKFADIDNVILLAMLPDPDMLPILTERIEKRGEDESITKQRKDLVHRDVETLLKYEAKVGQNGKLFFVKNNKTIPEDVIPWLLDRIGSAN